MRHFTKICFLVGLLLPGACIEYEITDEKPITGEANPPPVPVANRTDRVIQLGEQKADVFALSFCPKPRLGRNWTGNRIC